MANVHPGAPPGGRPARERGVVAARRWGLGVIVAAWVACFGMVRAAEPVPPARVLVLHSYHAGLAWTDAVQDGLEQAFRESTDRKSVV